MNTNTAQLAALTAAWRIQKDAENAAKAQRLNIEQQIIAITGKRDAGQMTVQTDDAKITIKTNITYSMDWDKWDAIAHHVPQHLHPVRTKRDIDEAGIKYLRDSQPGYYALITDALTRKENKPTVDIKPL